MDIAVKWRYFRHLLGFEDEGAVSRYLWHIEKRMGPRMAAGLPTDQWKFSVTDYTDAAQSLLQSMSHVGYLTTDPIPIDYHSELFGGAHRLACALAIGIPKVPVLKVPREVWAPRWGESWFVENGMDPEDLRKVRADYETLLGMKNEPNSRGLARS